MSSIRNLHIEQKTNLLTNIINNWIKENNHTLNNKNKIKFQNVSDWPKRSPFEFQNKNLIIPNDSNPLNKFNKSQKLKSINDNINLLIYKNRNENNSESKPIKVSLLSHDIKTPTGTIIIKPVSNEQSKVNQTLPNNINKRNEYKEKEIEYNFGYTKEERIEPLKLSLIKPKFDNNENESKINNEILVRNGYNITSIDMTKDNNINIEQEVNQIEDAINNKDLIKEDLPIKNEPKVLIIPKSEKEIAYYKEKDLFDEEIKADEGNNISQDQMENLGNDLNNIFKTFDENEKQKKFKIVHPYCDYKYHSIESEGIYNDINNIKEIYYKKYKRQENLINMLRKQRMILKNIISNNNKIFNKRYNLVKCKSSIYEYELNKEKEKNLIKKKIFKSYSTNDYYNEKNWVKRQNMYEKKKFYSIEVLLNEKRNLEERKRAKMIRLLRLKEERTKLYEDKKDDEDYDEIEVENNREKMNKLPDIKKGRNYFKEYEKNSNYDINKKRIYTNAYNPLKKYRLKKNEGEKILNTIIKHNPKIKELLNNHDLYNAKFEDIKSHIK